MIVDVLGNTLKRYELHLGWIGFFFFFKNGACVNNKIRNRHFSFRE